MSNPASRPDPRSGRGWITRILSSIFRLGGWLVGSLVLSILVEWVGMVFWWPDEGIDHSRALLEAEIGYLQNDFRRSVLARDPTRFALGLATRMDHLLFDAARWDGLVRRMTQVPDGPAQVVWRIGHRLYRRLMPYGMAAQQMVQVFCVRVAILTLALPVFLLFGLVALVEGLVARDLRRWRGGRESSFVYHHAKKAASPLLALCWISYLALPFSLHPAYIVLPFSTLFALSVAIAASTFKKYL